ncbi:hypothetical protein LOC71_13085 [Rhodopirellula sp. JC740]|uniref:Secreted protein n=1 Tax=Rhodopirellula halodulae TaxID=2894198 RepID=A0ABS8NI20_9BACT|nr:hypothetical protein [Rhodopirellula sp. JC740]
MNPRPLLLKLQRRLVQCVLVIAMLYQMGACPCGCLEHNAWLQLLGGFSHADGHPHPSLVQLSQNDSATTAAGEVSNSDDHDCTGEPTTLYTRSSRNPMPANGDCVQSLDFVDTANGAFGALMVVADERRRGIDLRGPNVRALSRPALQVFRL